MPIVSAFAIEGLDIYFNSSDHRPAHFHVESAAWHIRVYIDNSSKENGLLYDYKEPRYTAKHFQGIKRKQRQHLLANVIKHKDALLREWQEKVSSGEII